MKWNFVVSLSLLFTLLNVNSCKYAGPREGIANQVRVMYLDDPATSFTIGWQYFSKTKIPDQLAYGTDDFGEDFDSYPNKMRLQKTTSYKGIKTAFVKLENLEPDTRYYFVIKNSFGVSRRYYTQTLPDDRNARISIVAGGDSRNNRGPRQAANLLVSKLKPHFVYFGGDMTNLDFGFEWNRWLDDWQLTTSTDGRVTPIVAARGNHERSNRVLREFFDLPASNYYALSIADGLIRAYVLNTESSIAGEQTEWLESDLEEHQDSDWRLAIYHRPMRPHVQKKKEGTNQYTYWAPLFHKYKVDLVVESDSHTSKSTHPIVPSLDPDSEEGFVRDDANGTVFVGEGCWGAPLRDADDAKSWTRDSGSFNQFKWIFVDRQNIEIRTVKVDNAVDVEQLEEENRFTIPDGIDLWNPSEGEVQTLSVK